MADRFLDSLIGFPRYGGVQRSYNWDLLLPDIYGVLVSGIVVSRYCQSVEFHQYNIEDVVELKRGIKVRKFPAGMKIDLVRATFVAPTPDVVNLYFAKWRSIIVDRYGRFVPSDKYKRTGYLLLTDRSGIPSNVIKFTGMFPMRFPAFDLDYGREEPLMYHVDFSVDDVDMGVGAMMSLAKVVTSTIGGIGK